MAHQATGCFSDAARANSHPLKRAFQVRAPEGNRLGREAQQFWADGCLRTENCAFSIGRLLRKTRFRLVLGFLSSHLT
ncbi:hypothetical protein [Pseudorhizobium banfieldiae]|uniref:hypothetical protein n=1 Tax=Pseudorhizobium banfieldiae TaxID=1125847 RepID=UPI000ADB09E3|nr:hypothetical protein [Pseudorhizobium banfieldiae]